MIRCTLPAFALLGLLAGCAAPTGPAATSSVRQDTGIGATGSAGMSGGAAAPPAASGTVTTRP